MQYAPCFLLPAPCVLRPASCVVRPASCSVMPVLHYCRARRAKVVYAACDVLTYLRTLVGRHGSSGPQRRAVAGCPTAGYTCMEPVVRSYPNNKWSALYSAVGKGPEQDDQTDKLINERPRCAVAFGAGERHSRHLRFHPAIIPRQIASVLSCL
jgi:hypothetical protein